MSPVLVSPVTQALRRIPWLALQDKDHFAELAVDAVLRLKGASDLESIHIIKKPGGTLEVRLALVPTP